MQFLIILFCFGLATAIVGKIKGSSFLIWFLVGFVLPLIGLIAVLLSRWEQDEVTKTCPRCGKKLKAYVQVCTTCGEDL